MSMMMRARRGATAAVIAAGVLGGAACGGSETAADTAPTAGATVAAPATSAATGAPTRCPPTERIVADLGIPGLDAVTDPPAPTATTTLVCAWSAGQIGTEGGASVRFSVDVTPNPDDARTGYEFSRATLGSCARTDTCDPGEDIADDVFAGDERSFVTSDVSDLSDLGDAPFFSTVIIAAAHRTGMNCSLAVNLGSSERATVTAPVAAARRAVNAHCGG